MAATEATTGFSLLDSGQNCCHIFNIFIYIYIYISFCVHMVIIPREAIIVYKPEEGNNKSFALIHWQ